MTSTIARFEAFFAAANDGARPYPWQCQLVEQVASSGRWPDIGAPTGAGKSSVVDVHVFLVAEHHLGLIGVRPPRRLVLVAPRRVLVDDQFERASRLRNLLSAADPRAGEPLSSTATALRNMCTSADSPARLFGIWRLRGGVRLEPGWRLEPAACQIICATPQMWGSRLLFRGYGASRGSRNLETGMLAHDVVTVIDEAHLHERLVETGRNLAARSRKSGPNGLQVVAMSATARPSDSQVQLTEADLRDPHLAGRVQAVKHVRLVEVTDLRRDAPSALTQAAREQAGAGTVGVFVNDIATAIEVASDLSRGGSTVELVCGRMRPADLRALQERRPGLLTSRGNPAVEFLVSTQSLEVGVDLDLPAIVSMIAPASALAQRAGRLNRSGARPESTFTVIAPTGITDADPAESLRSGPYEAAELISGAAWLNSLRGSISPYDVSAAGLPPVDRPPLPALRRVDLDTLELTSHVHSADPDPSLYIEDPKREAAEVGLVARRHLDLEATVVEQMLCACPPRPHEIASVSLSASKELDRIWETVKDTAWLIRTREGEISAMPVPDRSQLQPADLIVVPDSAPICTAGAVGIPANGSAREPFAEVLEAGPDGPADKVVTFAASELEDLLEQDPSFGSRAERRALANRLDGPDNAEFAARLRRERLANFELHWCGGADAEVGALVISDMTTRAVQSPGTAPDARVSLDQHQAAVENRLADILDALDLELPPHEREALLLAARCHDEGKRHPRFQRRMGADLDGPPLAKPAPGHRPDPGDGWRHEQLSSAWAAHLSEHDPLVVAVVAAHHGHGRSLFDRSADASVDHWQECPQDVTDTASQLFGPSGRYELLRAAASRQHGAHRLAWLEMLLRCADMQISREGS